MPAIPIQTSALPSSPSSLAAQASAENVDAIRPLLDDSRSDVRAAAARCLGQAGKAAAAHRKALVDALAKTGSPEFKAAALHALAQIGGLTGRRH